MLVLWDADLGSHGEEETTSSVDACGLQTPQLFQLFTETNKLTYCTALQLSLKMVEGRSKMGCVFV